MASKLKLFTCDHVQVLQLEPGSSLDVKQVQHLSWQLGALYLNTKGCFLDPSPRFALLTASSHFASAIDFNAGRFQQGRFPYSFCLLCSLMLFVSDVDSLVRLKLHLNIP